jgi:hypothetical protein
VDEIKRIRRKFSARLAKAEREGRFMEELRAIEREGERARREIAGTAKKPGRRKQA